MCLIGLGGHAKKVANLALGKFSGWKGYSIARAKKR